MIRESVYKNEISMCGAYAYGRLAIRTKYGYEWNEPGKGRFIVQNAAAFFAVAKHFSEALNTGNVEIPARLTRSGNPVIMR